MKFSINIDINCSAKKVFDYLIDPKNLSEWVTDFTSFEIVKGSRKRKGGKGKHIFGTGAQKLVVQEETLLVNPNKEFKTFMYHKRMESTQSYLLHSKADQITALTFEIEMTMKPKILNFISPLAKGTMQKQQLRDLRKMKNVLESE